MLQNYFKVAIRQLLKNKVFSLINIFGLSTGIAICVLLALFIQDEFNYEQSFEGHERVYRMYTRFTINGKEESFARTSPPIAMDLAHELPEIETATRFVSPPEVEQNIVRYGEKVFYEKSGVLVDSSFFDVFPYPFKEGNPNTALDAPSTVVITETLNNKIFGDKSGIDELLIINSGRSVDTFRVTGIIKKTPVRSHVNADFYMCMNSSGWGEWIQGERTWAWNNFMGSYVKLKPGALAANIESKLPDMLEKRAGADLKNAGMKKSLHLQALDDVRLYSEFNSSFAGTEVSGIKNIYILGSIGVFILLLACINFMNLTTAKAAQRAGEVGIRKSMGAYRSNLIRQFLGESFSIVAVALVLSILFVWLALPVVNQIAQKDLSINSTNVVFLVAALLGVGLVTGLVAGSYPAFFLSAFNPVLVMRSKNMVGDGSQLLRKSLVVFQFVIAITLISSILIVQEQMRFINNKPLGFEPENVVAIPLRTREAADQFLTLRNELKQIAGVKEVSAATSLPSTQVFRDFGLYKQGSSMDESVLHRVVQCDENYFSTVGIKLIAGRDFKAETDTFTYRGTRNRIIVNEQSLKVFNISLENAIGSHIMTEWEGVIRDHEIIGVVQDYHQFSLHQAMGPMLFHVPNRRTEYINITALVEGGNYNSSIAQMKNAWDKLNPTTPFESQLLTDIVSSQYENDSRVSSMLTISTVLAIVISCLGLYGLSIFVAERKQREIGIRKVLGASASGIVAMLSKDFVILVMIAFAIAVPLGIYGMNKWLEGFAYKITPGITVFVLAGVVSFLIAWITVGFESIRAALSNPVKALRSE
jgi:putative ABC transport system permease protein